tara:strand:- start:1459 stop:2253 length:795 start_codon:yes stop_codon:yes gene_type:complete
LVFNDQLNRTLSFSSYPKRIISLVPSQTELLFHLGLDKKVVGVTKFCIYPTDWKTRKTIVGGTKNIKIDLIKELNPDLIIANKEENDEDSLRKLMPIFPVWISDIKRLEDAFQMILSVGRITNSESTSFTWTEKIKKQFKILSRLPKQPRRVAYLIWNNPLMSVNQDTFIHSLLELNQWDNCFKDKLNRYPEITEEELVDSNPEMVFLSSEPFPFKDKHIDRFKQLLPESRVVLVNGEYFSWYGSRLVDSPAYFSSIHKSLLSN